MGTEHSRKDRNLNRDAFGHKLRLPICLSAFWVFLELIPAFVPDPWYDNVYFFTEDLASVVIFAVMYSSLAYTAIVMKGISLAGCTFAISLMIVNWSSWLMDAPENFSLSIFLTLVYTLLLLLLIRFMVRVEDTNDISPDPKRIYMIVTRPRDLWGVVMLLLSGLGGGFSMYLDGDCYWFPRKEGILIKEYDPDWYKNKYIIDCGDATPERITELEDMIGRKWSIFNNCFTAFLPLYRRWS